MVQSTDALFATTTCCYQLALLHQDNNQSPFAIDHWSILSDNFFTTTTTSIVTTEYEYCYSYYYYSELQSTGTSTPTPYEYYGVRALILLYSARITGGDDPEKEQVAQYLCNQSSEKQRQKIQR
jgi:hypothetical protein